jgi:putative tryptophan/tyrosine transport system substrate-binding protein
VAPKRVELLHELAPAAATVALLVNPTNPYAVPETRESQVAAHALGLRLHVLNASNENEIERAFAALVEQRAGALVVGADSVFQNLLRDQLVALAARHRVPAIYGYRESTAAGGLMCRRGDLVSQGGEERNRRSQASFNRNEGDGRADA